MMPLYLQKFLENQTSPIYHAAKAKQGRIYLPCRIGKELNLEKLNPGI